MDPLTTDLLKIVIDKLLIGLIVVGFGYYLNRLLEEYRTRNTYQLSRLSQKDDACKSMMSLLAIRHQNVTDLFWVMEDICRTPRPNGQLTEAELKVIEGVEQNAATFMAQAVPYIPHLPTAMMEASIRYIAESVKIIDTIYEAAKIDALLIENLEETFTKALLAYNEEIANGHSQQRQIHRKAT